MFRNLWLVAHIISLLIVIHQIFSIQIVEFPPEIMTQRMDSVEIHDLEDIKTPIGVPLSGKYKRSFGYETIKDRLPVIVTRIIDTMSRDKEEMISKYGDGTAEEIKHIIGCISKMKNEMVTNKELKPLTLLSENDEDGIIWNKFLEERTEIEGKTPTWYNTIWIYCECYLYRRIYQELALTKHLKTYDPFEKQKVTAFNNSLSSINIVSEFVMDLINKGNKLTPAERENGFIQLLKINLWGNKCDLSLSGGAECSASGNPLDFVDTFQKDLLVDDSQLIWDLLSKNTTGIVDIVLDNAGYELFTDLTFAAFITSQKFTTKIRFYVKRYPWYVSDVTVNDFHWTIETMKNSSNEILKSLGEICHDYLAKGVWTIEMENFWTEPYTFDEIKKRDPTLYAKFSEAVLVIFKGDLNYRKLVGDINWEYTTDFVQALQEFEPTNIASLRTIKCDVCVGLASGQAEVVEKEDKDWLHTGKYGLIETTLGSKCKCN
ncbi:damage-control phosphatase ARMT1-like [Leptopilina heterotoma]|uniref:damage-control phosphatase ARMT1-like n=1 Tax=Leptopilina heterotoma TaxID=63436 RepID=UPI001CA8331E|nr:damage-control phosphatase ARMT1-like [Leptopilina heterotoma]